MAKLPWWSRHFNLAYIRLGLAMALGNVTSAPTDRLKQHEIIFDIESFYSFLLSFLLFESTLVF